MNQSKIFLESEGDAFWKRNAEKLATYSIENDVVAAVIEDADLSPRSILDLGCSSGERLEALCLRYGAQGYGVDASRAAIRVATRRSWCVDWEVGDWTHGYWGEFDLVILSYVCHWVDPKHLLRALATVDGSLTPGGRLVINDWSMEDDVPYKHTPGVITRKRKYEDMFLATKLYRTMKRVEYTYPGSDEPCACTLLERVG